ncbi:MAG: SufD family Fe-S cluster assembly protein [Erysipelotrichaceae bacterium]|nr:SufD family Fe-S cluster assembly protein [Erysipelotrichaceae bacterium]
MMLIKDDTTIELTGTYQSITIDTDHDIAIRIDSTADTELFFRIIKAKKIEIDADIRNSCSILFWNDSEEDIETMENYSVLSACDLNLAYGECNSAKTTRNTEVLLDHEHSNALLSTASLISTEKKYNIVLTNNQPKTNAQIKNYAVVLNGGRLMIDAVGKIVKGAKKSESHQVSRALSFEEGQSATILPELLIDENDVQASHAMSIGKVEEKDLFYMMSRGLSLKECTKLISLGYLLPITETISDETLKETLQKELERKISELCMM